MTIKFRSRYEDRQRRDRVIGTANEAPWFRLMIEWGKETAQEIRRVISV